MLKLVNRNVFYDIMIAQHEDIPIIHDIDARSLVSRVSENWLNERRDRYTDKFFVARIVDTGEIIGYITGAENLYYRDLLPGYVYISRFAIKENYRRCKVGTALFFAMFNHIKESNVYNGLVGDIRKSNIPSLRFFKGKSFVAHPTLSCPESYGGETYEDRYKVVLYYPFRMEDRPI